MALSLSSFTSRHLVNDWLNFDTQGVRMDPVGFLKVNQGLPYSELVNLISVKIAPIRLIQVLGRDLAGQEQFEWFLRDFLARRINKICGGGAWKNDEFKSIRAVTAWGAVIYEIDTRLKEATTKIEKALLADPEIPAGWEPSGPDDPHIVRAFSGFTFNFGQSGKLQ